MLQITLMQAVLKKLFQNMQVGSLVAQPELLPHLAIGLQHPADGIREVAADTLRRLLLNLPPSYIEITTLPDAIDDSVSRRGDAARDAAVANDVLATTGLVHSVALCIGDARILVAERASEILVALAHAATRDDTCDVIARAISAAAGAVCGESAGEALK